MAGGRPPKEKSFYNALSVALNQANGVDLEGKRITKLRTIAEKLVEAAEAGESWAIREVADRIDGKPMQAIEGICGAGGVSRGGLYYKDTEKDVVWPSEMIDHECGSEALAAALGELLNILMDKGVISNQDAINIVPNASIWYTADRNFGKD